MGRRGSRSNQSTGFDLERLRAELCTDSGRPGAVRPSQEFYRLGDPNLAVGRLVVGDAMRTFQDELTKTAARFGFPTVRRWAALGISYITAGQLARISDHYPDRPLPAQPADMLPTVLARCASPEAVTASGLRLTEPVPNIGRLALRFEPKRRGNDNRTQRLELWLRHSEASEQLQRERAAAVDALWPADESDAVRLSSKHLTIPLVEVNFDNVTNRPRLQELMQQPFPIPDSVDLGPLDSFDNTPALLR